VPLQWMRPMPSTKEKEIGSLDRGNGPTSFWSIRNLFKIAAAVFWRSKVDKPGWPGKECSKGSIPLRNLGARVESSTKRSQWSVPGERSRVRAAISCDWLETKNQVKPNEFGKIRGLERSLWSRSQHRC